MMLATWLAEFYLSKCNELDDLAASSSASFDVENVKAEQMMLEEDLRHFFKTYKARTHFIWIDYDIDLVVFRITSTPRPCTN